MPKPTKLPVALPPEARERLLMLIAQSSEPQSAKHWAAGLSEFFKAAEKQVAPLLTELVATQALHEFAPLRGKALRYWDRGLNDYAQQVLLATLNAKGSLKLADLKKAVLKAAKGLSDAQFRELFERLMQERQVYEHPPISSRAKTAQFGTLPPASAPYLKAATDELRKVVTKLTSAGVSLAVLSEAGMQMLRVAGLEVRAASTERSPTLDTTVDLIQLMRSIEPRAETGALVILPELRQAAGMPKEAFDEAVLQLGRDGRLTLHRHDFPGNLGVSERDALVTDGRGNFYIGVGLRRSADGSRT